MKSLGLDKVGSEVRRVTAADHAVLGGPRGHDLRGSTRQGPSHLSREGAEHSSLLVPRRSRQRTGSYAEATTGEPETVKPMRGSDVVPLGWCIEAMQHSLERVRGIRWDDVVGQYAACATVCQCR